MSKQVLEALVKKFGDAIEETHTTKAGDDIAVVKRDKLVEVAEFLKNDPAMAMNFPVFVTCIDRYEDDVRFEVCYQVRSLQKAHTVRLKVRVEEDDAKVPTLSHLYKAFNWQERETFDMYGIEFTGHPDLRRIYMYEEFEGYPLRKDYPKDKRQPLVRRDWDDEVTDVGSTAQRTGGN